jgi:ankyrin repeat protein
LSFFPHRFNRLSIASDPRPNGASNGSRPPNASGSGPGAFPIGSPRSGSIYFRSPVSVDEVAEGVTANIGLRRRGQNDAGAKGQFDGPDQVNFFRQALAGSGRVEITLNADGRIANKVTATVQMRSGLRSRGDNMHRHFRLAAVLLATGPVWGAEPDYVRDIRPVLVEKCYVCHGPAQQQGGLRMDRQQDRISAAGGGAQSELVRRITSKDPAVRMPPRPTSLGLEPGEVDILKAWGAAGALGEDPAAIAPRTVSLLAAVDREDTAQVRAILKNRALVNVPDSDGASPLMHAALNTGTESMKILLEHGADPNLRNNEGATALIWAADDAAKVKLLLAAGADVTPKTKHGGTALLAASLPYGSSSVVAQLLARGASVAVTDLDFWTPLLRASASGDVESMKFLLAHDADPNAVTGFNPLTAAVWYGNLNGVRLLLAKGARVDGKDAFGFTPLVLASLWDNKEIARALLEKGADVNLPAVDLQFMKRSPGTPLMLAAYAETTNPDLVKMLLAGGAKVDFATPGGETAASRALEKGRSPVLAALLAVGAKEPARSASPKPRFVDPVPDVRNAVERSLALLQAADASFFRQTGCKSCHNQSLPAMALGLAAERGFRFDREAARRQSDTIATALKSQREKMLQWMDDEGPPLSGSYALVSLSAAAYPADNITAALTRNIAARQLPAGNWHPAGARPPMEYSDVQATAFAIRSMRLYGGGARAEEFETRIDRARKWLLSSEPRSTDERVFQLLGLYWAKTDAARLKKLAAAQLAEQRSDGGWAQLPTLSSDAYATGQVLYTLNQAGGLATTDPAYIRGVKYLRETQMPDGSWLVETHAIPIQPPLDAGFPHGRNQFISAAGTSWAAMALMLTVAAQAH